MKILVADDESELLETISTLLQIEGHRVCTAKDGLEAQHLLENASPTEPFDILITDIEMPGRSGTEVISDARNIDKNIAVLVMTAYGSSSLFAELVSLGIDRYIDKPFSRETLIADIRALGEKVRVRRSCDK